MEVVVYEQGASKKGGKFGTEILKQNTSGSLSLQLY